MSKQGFFAKLLGLSFLSVLVACGPQPRQTVEDLAPQEAPLHPDEADPVAARVNGTVIRRGDVQRELAAQAEARGRPVEGDQPGDEAYERVLDELIDQRLLALESRRRGLHRSVEARRRLALAEERILGNVLVETALADAVTEETIERIYREQVRLIPLGEEVRARHILVETREEAEAVKALLDQGEDFAQLAIRTSLDPATRLEGGDLGYFTQEGILAAFGAVAFATAEGAVSDPFQTEFGWHVLKVEDRRRQPPPTLEELRPNIVRFYTFDQLEGLIADLHESGEVERVVLDVPSDAIDDAVELDTEAAPDSDG